LDVTMPVRTSGPGVVRMTAVAITVTTTAPTMTAFLLDATGWTP
jgi:hypothetical protein